MFVVGSALPSGSTLRGYFTVTYSATAASQHMNSPISFGLPLAAEPVAHFIAANTTPPAGCPGSVNDPQAAAGHLCVYESDSSGSTIAASYPMICATGWCPHSTRWGAEVHVLSSSAGIIYTRGTWAVTAP